MYLIKEGEVKYLSRSDYFKPDFVTTRSWCRPNLLSQDNESAKRQAFDQKLQYITTFGSASLVGNEEIMRKLILDRAKERDLENI